MGTLDDSNSSSRSSDDEDMMEDWDVELPHSSSIAASKQKPDDDLQWNDRAIVECFQMAIDSHSLGHSGAAGNGADGKWEMPKLQLRNEVIEGPKPIPLPSWAVDPLLYFATKEQKPDTISGGNEAHP